jgi:hypothetical protein
MAVRTSPFRLASRRFGAGGVAWMLFVAVIVHKSPTAFRSAKPIVSSIVNVAPRR